MGSKFKMPPHPAFSNGFDLLAAQILPMSKQERSDLVDNQMSDMLRSFSSNREAVESITTKVQNGIARKPKYIEGKDDSFFTDELVRKEFLRARINMYTEMEMRAELYEEGCNLFKIESSHWDEDSSRKSIATLNTEDFKLPFPVCAIDISGASWARNYTLAMVSFFKENTRFSQLVIRLENEKEEWYTHYIPVNGTIEDSLNAVNCTEDEKGTVYRILSIMMYASAFKREKNRFEERKVKARRSKALPSYRINEVKLIQPEYFVTGKADRRNKTQDAYYRVKGHWRSQPFGKREEKKYKTIWIAPFWKGEERELITKVYKV